MVSTNPYDPSVTMDPLDLEIVYFLAITNRFDSEAANYGLIN